MARSREPKFVYFLLLGELCGLGLLLPVLPGFIAAEVGQGKPGVFWYGVVTLAYALAFFFSAGITGTLSDRYGRRPLMLLNCAGLALGNLASALAPGIWSLILARTVCGLSSTNICLAQAYVSDLTRSADRGARFGLLGAMQGVGFVLGPILGGYLGRENLRAPFLVTACMALVGGVLGWFFLTESLPREKRNPRAFLRLHPLEPLRVLGALPRFGPLVPAIGLLMLSQNTLFIVWVPYMTAKFGWDPAQNGLALFFVGIVACTAQALVFPFLLRFLSLRSISCLGLGSSVLGYLAIGVAREGWLIYGILAAIVTAYCVPVSFQTFASRLTDEKSQGRILGSLQALNNLALIPAVFLSASLLLIMAHFSPHDWRAGIPMYFCSFLNLVVWCLALSRFPGPTPQSPPVSEPDRFSGR